MANIIEIQNLVESINAALPNKVTVLGNSVLQSKPPANGVIAISNSGGVYFSIGNTLVSDWIRIDSKSSGLKPQGDWHAGTGTGFTEIPTIESLGTDDAGKFWVIDQIENDEESFTWVNPNSDGVDMILKLGDWAYWDGNGYSKISNAISNSYSKSEIDDLMNLNVLKSVYDLFVTSTTNSFDQLNLAFNDYVAKSLLTNRGDMLIGSGELDANDRPRIDVLPVGSVDMILMSKHGIPTWSVIPVAEPIIVDVIGTSSTSIPLLNLSDATNSTVSLQIRTKTTTDISSFFQLTILTDFNSNVEHTISNIIGPSNFEIIFQPDNSIELLNLDGQHWSSVRYFLIKF